LNAYQRLSNNILNGSNYVALDIEDGIPLTPVEIKESTNRWIHGACCWAWKLMEEAPAEWKTATLELQRIKHSLEDSSTKNIETHVLNRIIAPWY
jgi:hypothetical protein